MALSDARRRANAKWRQKHKQQSYIYSMRSTSKRFISKYATEQDLDDLQALLDKRKQALLTADKIDDKTSTSRDS